VSTPGYARTLERTALRGFKEDFDSWRATLTLEEKSMVQKQAEGEFNKKFRKSDDFKKDLPKEKITEFSNVLKKFFQAEAEDYKTDDDAKTPDYDGLKKKASQGSMDFSLKSKIIHVDRNADRRYAFASANIREAERKGELYPLSSPQKEKWTIANDDTESHETAVSVLKWIEAAGKEADCPDEAKKAIEKLVKRGVPAMGEQFDLVLPEALVKQINHMVEVLKREVSAFGKDKSKEEVDKFIEEKVPEIGARVIGHLSNKYFTARTEVEKEVDTMKAFYRSQKEMPGKTKADVLKEIWEELPKHTDKPVPPLDEEMLAELAEEPAVIEGEFRHNWGTADVLYKSEAIDAFGMKYLLGVFETKEEAAKAFDDWNSEYEKARSEMKAELEQWGKQEQARLDRDTEGQERIKEVLESAKAA
jgi:hypothetical protein